MDDKTRAMLRYGSKLTESPSLVDADDATKLKQAGWNDRAVWEIAALTSFFNFSGRMEAASGLPPDEIPAGAKMAEAKAG
jgi:alkylhydroperoxidase family enzyme